MAILNLKDVEVTRLNGKGNGVQVTESNENNGKTYSTRFTVWFTEPSGLNVGDKVSLSGFLGAKVGEPWQGREGQEMRSVELSLNSPRIQTGDGQAAAKAAPPAANDEPWAPAPGVYEDSELPF